MNNAIQDHASNQDFPLTATQHVAVEKVEYSDYFSQYSESFEASGDGDQAD